MRRSARSGIDCLRPYARNRFYIVSKCRQAVVNHDGIPSQGTAAPPPPWERTARRGFHSIGGWWQGLT